MDGTNPEICDECGFDSSPWRLRDARTLFEDLGWWWREATRGIDPAGLNRRPAEGVWSALEYGRHTAVVLAVIRAGLEMILQSDGLDLPSPPALEDATGTEADELDPREVVGRVEAESSAIAHLARDEHRPWDNTATMTDGTMLQARATLVHAAHDASHHLMDVSRGLVSLGLGMPAGRGVVSHLNTSDGGVPKTAVPEARVTYAGLSGDHSADRKHHGRAFQAVCMWSGDVIDSLRSQGHSLTPGAAGENLTVAGVDWAAMRPGTILRIGEVIVEASFPAVPCAKQRRWFSDGDFSRIHHEHNPGLARWYGWVREEGTIRPGDEILLQAPTGTPNP